MMTSSKFLIITCLFLFFIFPGCNDSEEEAAPEDEKNLNDQPVGISSADFLSAEQYGQLVIEVVYVKGYKPTAEAIGELKNFLGKRLNKPEGISISQREIASPGLAPYSIEDITAVEEKNRTAFTSGNTVAAFYFFADGGYAEDTENSKVLGVAYKNSSMAIFQKTIQDLSGDVLQPGRSLLEATVINHEFSHILGLVNVGTPMQSDHQDTAHGHHCDVPSCLMNYVAETGDVVSNLLDTQSVPTLDSQCIADLQANGGK